MFHLSNVTVKLNGDGKDDCQKPSIDLRYSWQLRAFTHTPDVDSDADSLDFVTSSKLLIRSDEGSCRES